MNPYEFGVSMALQNSGLLKTAAAGDDWGPVLPAILSSPITMGPIGGAIGGAIAAPEGKGWEAAGKTGLGSLIGLIGGAAAGTILGRLVGNPKAGASLAAIPATSYGAYKGYQSATD